MDQSNTKEIALYDNEKEKKKKKLIPFKTQIYSYKIKIIFFLKSLKLKDRPINTAYHQIKGCRIGKLIAKSVNQ